LAVILVYFPFSCEIYCWQMWPLTFSVNHVSVRYYASMSVLACIGMKLRIFTATSYSVQAS